MPLSNCKVELKLKWAKYCVLSAAGADDVNNRDSNYIVFTINDTKLYVPVVTLSTRDNQKLSKLPSKGFERSVHWNENKTKRDNKNKTNEFRYFFKWKFVGVNRFFVLLYTNEHNNAKRFNARKYYFPKGIIKNYSVITNAKNVYDQAIDSDIKRYKEIRKLTTGQGEDFTTGCLLDYDYIKNRHILLAVDLSIQKELDTDRKVTQQIESIGQLKKLNANDSATDVGDNNQSMFVLTILEKIKEKRLKFSQGSVAVL